MNASIDVSHIRIETQRLILRPWADSDLEDLYTYASVPGVGEMAGWSHHASVEESRNILNMFIRGKKTLALELKESGKVIGSLGLEELDPDPVGEGKLGREIGYVLSKDCWGRGLMPEAVRGVVDYCFRVLHLDYLTCSHFVGNDQSRRVIEKCGFSFFGESMYETRYATQVVSRNYILHNPRNQAVDISDVNIETPRLLLRPWKEGDLQDLFAYSSIPEVGEMAGWPALRSLEEAKEVLDGFLAEPYVFAIERKCTGKVVGSLCVDWLEPDPETNYAKVLILGNDLHKDCWGQGLMPEAVEAVIPHCFQKLYADFLRCSISVKNTRSRRVAEKCGFQFFKEWDFPTQGTVERHVVYMLRNPKDLDL